MTYTDLRTPTEWESHEGIRIANRHVYRIHGRHEFTPISYETFRNITETLTVSMIPKSDTVSTEGLDGRSTSHARLILESRLKERIETKIEEYRESMDNGLGLNTYEAGFEDGTIRGLKLALLILEES